MGIIETIVVSIGLAMDAFAVSICKGMSTDKLRLKHYIIVGLYFGGFQFLMPIIGYYVGINFSGIISSIDHWIALIVLGIIGINMIRESFLDDESINSSYTPKDMIPLAVATSIDAIAVGVTLGVLKANIFYSSLSIGVITFVISAMGLKIGKIFGDKLKNKAELIGGILLILIGIKIVIEHLIA